MDAFKWKKLFNGEITLLFKPVPPIGTYVHTFWVYEMHIGNLY